MGLMESLKLRARVRPQRIVLPEGEDRRVVAAAAQVVREGYAAVTLLGREQVIRAVASEAGMSLDGVKLLNPAASPALENYARILYERRRPSGLTFNEAQTLASQPVYFAALAVAARDEDGMVGGAASAS